MENALFNNTVLGKIFYSGMQNRKANHNLERTTANLVTQKKLFNRNAGMRNAKLKLRNVGCRNLHPSLALFFHIQLIYSLKI